MPQVEEALSLCKCVGERTRGQRHRALQQRQQAVTEAVERGGKGHARLAEADQVRRLLRPLVAGCLGTRQWEGVLKSGLDSAVEVAHEGRAELRRHRQLGLDRLRVKCLALGPHALYERLIDAVVAHEEEAHIAERLVDLGAELAGVSGPEVHDWSDEARHMSEPPHTRREPNSRRS